MKSFLLKYAGLLSALGFVIFIGNSIVGKVMLASGTGIAPPIDGVPEFVLLAASVAFLATWLEQKVKQEEIEN